MKIGGRRSGNEWKKKVLQDLNSFDRMQRAERMNSARSNTRLLKINRIPNLEYRCRPASVWRHWSDISACLLPSATCTQQHYHLSLVDGGNIERQLICSSAVSVAIFAKGSGASASFDREGKNGAWMVLSTKIFLESIGACLILGACWNCFIHNPTCLSIFALQCENEKSTAIYITPLRSYMPHLGFPLVSTLYPFVPAWTWVIPSRAWTTAVGPVRYKADYYVAWSLVARGLIEDGVLDLFSHFFGPIPGAGAPLPRSALHSYTPFLTVGARCVEFEEPNYDSRLSVFEILRLPCLLVPSPLPLDHDGGKTLPLQWYLPTPPQGQSATRVNSSTVAVAARWCSKVLLGERQTHLKRLDVATWSPETTLRWQREERDIRFKYRRLGRKQGREEGVSASKSLEVWGYSRARALPFL
ncbi:hypothetical protein BDV93DRAFT_507637 [Ceratobasidium sp. AG-I]|nr:hypothetical protein BDV93DRAFT_507637 [Ceratobasidium sp. AG-I]